MPEFRLAALVDPDPACAALAAELGVKCHDSVERLPDTIKLAFVAVPSSQHANVVCTLARRDVHCLVEKPAGENADEVAAMLAASDISGACIRVGFAERFHPVIASLLSAPRAQAPSTLAVRRHSSHALDIPRDGDVLRDLLAHDLDWVCALANAAPSQVEVLDARRHYERWEAIRCRLRFPNGLDVDLSASRIATRAELAVHVAGKGVLPLDGAPEDALAAQARAFLEAVQDLRTPLATLEHAFATHRLLDQIERAAVQLEATHAA
jgi:predicted dehydrogenase